jgi:hypothetical protein
MRPAVIAVRETCVSRTRWDLEYPVLESARHSPGGEPFSAQPENTRSALLVSAPAVILNIVKWHVLKPTRHLLS